MTKDKPSIAELIMEYAIVFSEAIKPFLEDDFFDVRIAITSFGKKTKIIKISWTCRIV